MNQTPETTTLPITLESIALQKAQIRQQIQQQKEVMSLLAQDIIAPITPVAGKTGSMMRAFNTGMAAFDGIMLGLKIIRRMRKLFRR